MKLQQKYFLSYLFFISLFSAFLIGLMTFFFTTQSRKELRTSAEKTFSQTATLLNYQFKQYLYTSYIVSSAEELSDAQSIPDSEVKDSVGIQHREAISLRNVINRSIMSLTDVQMRLYIDDSFHLIMDHNILEDVSVLESQPWYEDFLSDNTLTTWQRSSQSQKYSDETLPSLSLFHKVNTVPAKGWVCELYISQEKLKNILSNATPSASGIVFLQSDDDVLLSSTDEGLSEEFLLEHRDSFRRGSMDWELFSLNGRQYWVYSQPLSSTSWYLTLLLPSDAVYHSPDALLLYALLALALVLVISLIAAKLFTQGFSGRLLHLEKKMAALCAGNLDTRIEVRGNDEVAQLFGSFNHMASEMKKLVQQQYENGILVKNAEMKALQEQINPHFLYNTLELINWKAMESDSAEIVEISQELARFYRLTLNNGQSMVPLRDELEHITRYISIQNFRFAQQVQLLTDIPEDCLDLLMPRLTLQPLIENSVLHGFLPKEDFTEAENIIFIKASRTETALVLTLQDNGVGMPADQMQQLLSQDQTAGSSGFGVLNIQQRLQMLYGKEYGLSYKKSEEGTGVCVLIRLKIG